VFVLYTVSWRAIKPEIVCAMRQSAIPSNIRPAV
jgi:hypothetical protein